MSNSTRLPYAAERLIEEVKTAWPDVLIDTDDTDGFGVHRTLHVVGADGLAEALEVVNDPRISLVRLNGSGLSITFVGGPKADTRLSFGVVRAKALLADPPKPRRRRSAETEVVDTPLPTVVSSDPGIVAVSAGAPNDDYAIDRSDTPSETSSTDSGGSDSSSSDGGGGGGE